MKHLGKTIKNRVQSWFVTAEQIEQQPYEAFRTLMMVGILFVIIAVLLAFILFHIFATGLYQNIWINSSAIGILLILLWRLYQTKQMGWIGHGLVLAIIWFFPTFFYINQAQELSSIWMFFVPFVVIAIIGRHAGIKYLLVFYAILFTMAYQGLGNWDHGTWSELSFFRLVLASFLGTALAYVMDMANTDLNNKVSQQKAEQHAYSQELRRLSTTDQLTSVYNRHYFQEMVQAKIAELKGTQSYLTFFILDIDFFKLYNDAYGHDRGDVVLKLIAQTVHRYIKRHDDLVFRLGGEEFGGLLVTDNPQETANWVAQLKDEVEALHIPHASDSTLPYVTVSIGIFSAKVTDESTMACLYRVADRALYQAKQSGRNRAVIIPAEVGAKECL